MKRSRVPRHSIGPRPAVALAALLAATACACACAASAQERWNPFEENGGIARPPRRETKSVDPAAARPPLPPMKGEPGTGGNYDSAGASGRDDAPPQGDSRPTFAPRQAVESTDLAPLTAPDAPAARPAPGGGPVQAATGQGDPNAVKAIEPLLTGLDVPSRSPALSALFRRLVSQPTGVLAGNSPEMIAVRAEALYRAGHYSEALAQLPAADAETSAVLAAMIARVALAAGDRPRTCTAAKSAMPGRAGLPAQLKSEVLLIQGWCGAADGNPAAAGLLAALAREDRSATPETLAALDAVAVGESPKLASLKRISVLDYRLAELASPDGVALPVDRAEAALLGLIAAEQTRNPKTRLEAAESAARLNVIDAAGLAAIYRQQAFSAEDLAQPQNARVETHARRALLLKAAEAERTPLKKTRLVRALLDDARRGGLYLHIAQALAPVVEQIRPAVEIGWFAETAIETLLAAGQLDKARGWVPNGMQAGTAQVGTAGPAALAHWLALIDVADPGPRGRTGENLGAVEDLALRGRFSADGLHRLATVLDALDYQVPMRLWEAASRAAQPTTGFLPATGVLADLQEAAKRKDQTRTSLLVIRALGPNAAEGAHIIALGDAIRALRRAGMEKEARQVALEALFALWPRTSNT